MITRTVAFLFGALIFTTPPLPAAENGKTPHKEFPNCTQGLTDGDLALVNALISGKLLAANDAKPQIIPAKVTLAGDYFTWDVRNGGTFPTFERGERVVDASVVRRRSNRPLVIFEDGDYLLELLPTAGWKVRVELWGEFPLRADDLSLDGRWLSEHPRYNGLEYHNAAIGNQRVSTQISARPDGTLLFRHISTPDDRPAPTKTGEVLELDDGRRFVFTESGNLRPIPSQGFSRILAGRARYDAVNAAVTSVHAALEVISADAHFPPLHEIYEAEALTAESNTPPKSYFTAILGPAEGVDRERWVMVVAPAQKKIITPEATRPDETLTLEDGRQLFARDGRWWVNTRRGGQSAAPTSAPSPRPIPPRPGAADEALAVEH